MWRLWLVALLAALTVLAPAAAPAQGGLGERGSGDTAAPARVTDGAALGVVGGDCRVGPGLGASLLVPYFEVDLRDLAGVNTLFSIINGVDVPTLVRVVVWTDWAVATLAFDVYLGGLDIQTVSVRDVLNGNLPSTGGGADLGAFPFCDTLSPTVVNPALTGDEVAQARADHQGQPGPIFFECAGEDHGDGVARGFITVDVVDECSGVEGSEPVFTPANVSWPYFPNPDGSLGVGNDPTAVGQPHNRLAGDVLYIDTSKNSAQGGEAVSVWADPERFTGPDRRTFYGRYSAWDGRDRRVPLPSDFDQRFLNGGAFDGGADLIVFQDTESVGQIAVCGSVPHWYPLDTDMVALDEDGGSLTAVDQTRLPLATQRLSIDTLNLPILFGFTRIASSRQKWVQPVLTAGTRFSVGLNGIPVGFLCDVPPPTPAGAGEEMGAAGRIRGFP